ncbi:MAG TPA: nicotinate-nucleotide--dimethylbenzimidazole phosphoribosyltransferase [Gelria sp.]|jgi:nicotinate-nucleotide--dimethylbenzimidazole phosphoribosyltransferase|nr:nicotinate-nucleotide--dimethylbenzimidazole phosphoribosyltransferase [Gelria sp.]
MLENISRRVATGRLAYWYEKLKKLAGQDLQSILIIFAADNGISVEYCSTYKPMQSALIVQEHLHGQSPTSKLLKAMEIREIIVDVGLATPVNDVRILNRNVCRGSRNFLQEDALKKEEVTGAIQTGAKLWDEISCSDFDIIAIGEIGISNTLCAAAIASAVSGLHPDLLTGKGSGDSKVIAEKVDIICKGLDLRRPDATNIVDILTRFGGLEIAALTGFISQARKKKTLLMLDGYVTSVAALLASITEPEVVEYLLAPSLSVETGHQFILDKLGLDFLFNMDINYGEGLAAVLGLYLARLITKL